MVPGGVGAAGRFGLVPGGVGKTGMSGGSAWATTLPVALAAPWS